MLFFVTTHGHSCLYPLTRVSLAATIIRIILALAVHYNWPLRQVDINNAFLHGDLIELVFMQQPPGFENATTPTYVCKLNKALYDLKQAPRAWFAKLTSTLTMWDFTISKIEVTHQSTWLHLTQTKYIEDLLTKTRMIGATPNDWSNTNNNTMPHLLSIISI
ncbi:Retrovirus-related Pol polyprotein from transposon RE1 [Vitis vinifera]|uniref:Retrovirus-related Pol polyprotein from transposon RE1 n=1 Tax=Vitis vinifera TaxID=29760 RepID=A0A438D369_VITVI|nr:Retrovirus-related Pol polyprotein from transposon RE1 [Vitis vinifera]